MTKTTNYKLNMPEVGDALSIAPLNENTQKIDALLRGMTKKVCGSYTGDGKMSVTIATPGMKPQAVVMRGYRYTEPVAAAMDIELATLREAQFGGGFILWIGQDITRNYWIKNGKLWDSYDQEEKNAYYERARSCSPAQTVVLPGH